MTTVEHSIQFVNSAWAHQRAYVKRNAGLRRMVLPDYGKDQTVVICGAGPSLALHIEEVLAKVKPNQVWGCNSALTWLTQHRLRVTHGIAVAGEDGLLEDWKPFPNVQYLVSSGVNPTVVRCLEAKHRSLQFFHVLLGLFRESENAISTKAEAEELAFYARLYPKGITVRGGGYNVANMAVALASGCGFTRIVLVGADCCFGLTDDPMPEDDAGLLDWKRRQTMYVDGRDVVTAFGESVLPIENTIGGRRFATRPDMLMSAVELVGLKQKLGLRLEIVGDTLPNWLRSLPEEHWRPLIPVIEHGVLTNLRPRSISPDAIPCMQELALSKGSD